jgi:transposase
MPKAILNWEKVRAIRALANDPATTNKSIAKAFGVSESTIACVVQGLNWKEPGYRPTKKPKNKLNWPQVRDIRRRYAAGETLLTLGREFGVSTVAVHYIVTGHHWKDDPQQYVWDTLAAGRVKARGPKRPQPKQEERHA